MVWVEERVLWGDMGSLVIKVQVKGYKRSWEKEERRNGINSGVKHEIANSDRLL